MTLFTLISIILLSALKVTWAAYIGRRSVQNVCHSPHCQEAAARVIASMDMSVDPCTDFYQFACGGWIAKNPIPSNKESINILTKLEKANLGSMREILESPYKVDETLSPDETEHDKAVFSKIQTMYSQCTNVADFDRLKGAPLKDLLSEIRIKYPMFQKEDNSKLDPTHFARALGYVDSFGTDAFFQLTLSYEQQGDNLKRIITIRSPNRSAESTVVQAISSIWKALGIYHDVDPDAIARSIVDFETKLEQLTKVMQETRSNTTSIGSLNQTGSWFNWLEYFDSRFGGLTTGDETFVELVAADFLKEWESLLQSTPAFTVENYVLWRTIVWLDSFLSNDTGESPKVSGDLRWRTCVTLINNLLGQYASRWFVAQKLTHEARGTAQVMMAQVKDAFLSRLRTLDWIDQDTASYAAVKAEAMSHYIGYPDHILRPSETAKTLADLNTSSNYLKTVVTAIRFKSANVYKDFLNSVVPQVARAFYSHPKNTIVLTAGILQAPYFSDQHPDYLNYGAFGSVIGHELSHGFDNKGRNFDANGRARDWWTDKSEQEFRKRAQCFVEQYGNYSVSGPNNEVIPIDGKNTLGENLSDNAGVMLALQAYKTHGRGNSFVLPGLEQFTPEQLFWVGFAQYWCAATRPSSNFVAAHGPHSPEKFRVIGTVSNSEEFATAFKCPKSSPMNPEQKCALW